MVRIAPIRLAYNPKTLWFDAGQLDFHKNDAVVVTTARGTEFGRLAEEVFDATDDQIKKLRSPLKPVERLASEEDVARAEEMCRRSEEALPIYKEMAAEASEDMHPVSVEFLLDGDKAIFYFEAEERVDFRELVRKLAARFHVRIDMRQIGVRDEARMVGGLGHCGQELCCKRLGGEFCPVSIRMAKEQDLSLNPQKISGVCGRLMCCLRYEFDAYKDFKSRAPKYGSSVETPLGSAKVVDLDVPREVISLKISGEKPVKVPLANFEKPEEGTHRPNRVGADAWKEATTQATMAIAGESTFLTSQFTSTDKLADPSNVRHTGTGDKENTKARGSKAKGTDQASPVRAEGSSETRKPRRRRSTKVGGEGDATPVATDQQTERRRSKPQASSPSQPKAQTSAKRPGSTSGKKAQGSGVSSSSSVRNAERVPEGREGQPKAKSRQRPGQKSSGLRQQPSGSQQVQQNSPKNSAPSSGGDAGRRKRRRSHRSGQQEGGASPSSDAQ